MRIGKRPDWGDAWKLNKWYFGIEFLRCPPGRINIFRPFIFLWFVKWEDFGERHLINGRIEKRKGITKEWNSPIEIEFKFRISNANKLTRRNK